VQHSSCWQTLTLLLGHARMILGSLFVACLVFRRMLHFNFPKQNLTCRYALLVAVRK
jgi:hypothetical protein